MYERWWQLCQWWGLAINIITIICRLEIVHVYTKQYIWVSFASRKTISLKEKKHEHEHRDSNVWEMVKGIRDVNISKKVTLWIWTSHHMTFFPPWRRSCYKYINVSILNILNEWYLTLADYYTAVSRPCYHNLKLLCRFKNDMMLTQPPTLPLLFSHHPSRYYEFNLRLSHMVWSGMVSIYWVVHIINASTKELTQVMPRECISHTSPLEGYD